ncbi:hypothetical protein A4X06_0g4564 [Tilletia controversa]|uniref:Uncharacterized protein n=1 Tax=Tilletia controversa TaxID=13291 RepID=A0A8X7SWR3_9BASI|nr:hypothetical protein A4X06_0g4564 [Tilletia controversa]
MAQQNHNMEAIAEPSQPVASGHGVPRLNSIGPGILTTSYPAPEIKHLREGEGRQALLDRPIDPEVQREMDTLTQLSTSSTQPLTASNWRTWSFKIWTTLAFLPITHRMLVGLEYGPGMNKADPLAYTGSYDERLDVMLGRFLVKTLDQNFLSAVIKKFGKNGELRGTMVLDVVSQKYEKGAPQQHKLVSKEIWRCTQGATETFRNYGARLRALYHRQWDIGEQQAEAEGDISEESKIYHFLNNLQPDFRGDATDRIWASLSDTRINGGTELDEVIAHFECIDLDLNLGAAKPPQVPQASKAKQKNASQSSKRGRRRKR